MEIGIPLLFILVGVYTLFAARLDRWSITMPMIFVSIGALVGPTGLGLIKQTLTASTVKELTEITLALLLFSDASALSFRQVNEDKKLPARLLFIGMPLTITLAGLTMLIIYPSEGIAFALLLGAILAPTDAALGLPIFTNPRVPARIRRALNVESGLNDGLATPFVTLFTALAIAEEGASIGRPVEEALLQIGIAVGVAILIGVGLGWSMARASEHGWTSNISRHIAGFALPMACYFGSVFLGGNGFIAAFVGGLLFGHFAGEYGHSGSESADSLGMLLSLFVWTTFGVLIVGPILVVFNWSAVVYALLALTLVRMLPVALSMIGIHFRRDTLLFMGWFGPRGLASVVFVILALESFQEVGRSVDTLIDVAGWTILLSVLLHGFSARPLANLYAKRLKNVSPDASEFKVVSDIGKIRPAFGESTRRTDS